MQLKYVFLMFLIVSEWLLHFLIFFFSLTLFLMFEQCFEALDVINTAELQIFFLFLFED